MAGDGPEMHVEGEPEDQDEQVLFFAVKYLVHVVSADGPE